MSAKRLVSEYIETAETVLRKIQTGRTTVNLEQNKIEEVVGWAKDYLEDAKFYREKKKFEISLTSVAYCEGLLDALRLLGAVSFEWPSKTKKARRPK
jgi:hypothetical protein